MGFRLPLLLLGLVALTGAADAATDLVLQDDRVVTGVEIRLEHDAYVLVMERGEAIVVPVALVKAVRLSGESDAQAAADDESAENDDSTRRVSSGLVEAEPRTLAGLPVRPTSRAEQLKVFGDPARFRPSIVDNRFEPTDDRLMAPGANNNFAPSRWAADVVDNDWAPVSAFDRGRDVLENSRSRWRSSIIDNRWIPTDGFSR